MNLHVKDACEVHRQHQAIALAMLRALCLYPCALIAALVACLPVRANKGKDVLNNLCAYLAGMLELEDVVLE